MSVEAGQYLLHYRLIEKIGEGGMDVVWRAEDTRLGREVALKVLQGAAVDDAARLARLEREAKAAAARKTTQTLSPCSASRKTTARSLPDARARRGTAP